MKAFSSFARSCTHQPLPLRSIPSRSLAHPSSKLRTLTTTTTQPIQHTSSTTPTSASEHSTLTSSTLSRAPTDPTTQPSSSSTSSPFLLLGTVTRTGTMTHTVQLTSQQQTFDRFLQKHYTRPSRLLAHDPNPKGYLREGDVVEYGLFSAEEKAVKEEKRRTLEARLVEKGVIRLRTRKGKERSLSDVGVKKQGPRWVVRRVVGPFGVAVGER